MNMALAWPKWRYPLGSGGNLVMYLPPVSFRYLSSSALVFEILRGSLPSEKFTVVWTALFSSGLAKMAWGSAFLWFSSSSLLSSSLDLLPFPPAPASSSFFFAFFFFGLAESASVFGPRTSRTFLSYVDLSTLPSAHLLTPKSLKSLSSLGTSLYLSCLSLSPRPPVPRNASKAFSMSASDTTTPIPPASLYSASLRASPPNLLRYSKQPSSWAFVLRSPPITSATTLARCARAFGGNFPATVYSRFPRFLSSKPVDVHPASSIT
mmetsp:Transcript_8513/g.24328  ORF Transcript_8513/g.24328 Transcript_8513/m.24328 type:complete len:265 (-) Transcript_8513:190-984(-)